MSKHRKRFGKYKYFEISLDQEITRLLRLHYEKHLTVKHFSVKDLRKFITYFFNYLHRIGNKVMEDFNYQEAKKNLSMNKTW